MIAEGNAVELEQRSGAGNTGCVFTTHENRGLEMASSASNPIAVSVGQRFGRLTTIEPQTVSYPSGSTQPHWLCRCDCGTMYLARALRLRAGTVLSCGCHRRTSTRKRPDAEKSPSVDLTGLRVGKLVVLRRSERQWWICQCDCGRELAMRASYLTAGRHKSCGCSGLGRRTHGLAAHNDPAVRGVYAIWRTMIGRCTNPKATHFEYYGGRGITVCDRWLDSCEAFVSDMGPRPPRATVERIDNSKGYEPGNCEWRTRKQQSRNTRANVLLTINGESKPLSAWAEQHGIPPGVFTSRIRLGWSFERAVSTPVAARRRRGRLVS